MQVTRVGRYKSAVEPYLLDRMSDANREQVSALLGDIWDDWTRAVADDRNLTAADLQGLSDRKGVLSGPEAQAAHLVDQLATPDQVLDELKALAGRKASDLEFPQVDLETYMRMPAQDQGHNRIAVVYAEGEIVDGPGRLGQVGGDRVSRELRKLRLDPQVKAIVLRVNSPGGSAMASDLIQREVILARKVKPLVVSMGYLAASGRLLDLHLRRPDLRGAQQHHRLHRGVRAAAQRPEAGQRPRDHLRPGADRPGWRAWTPSSGPRPGRNWTGSRPWWTGPTTSSWTGSPPAGI